MIEIGVWEGGKNVIFVLWPAKVLGRFIDARIVKWGGVRSEKPYQIFKCKTK